MIKPLTLRELSEKTGFPIKTLRRYIIEGMPVIRVGRDFFIREEAFDAWFLSHETTEYVPYHKKAEEEKSA